MKPEYIGSGVTKALEEMKKYERYGMVLRRRRMAKSLTLEDVAQKVGTHKGYLSGIENDQVRPPSPAITRRLCKALDMDFRSMVMRSWAEKAPKAVRADAIDLVFRHYL